MSAWASREVTTENPGTAALLAERLNTELIDHEDSNAESAGVAS
ncbi:hypothetical protein ABIA39_007211 [Nocardia sp. GAS34]